MGNKMREVRHDFTIQEMVELGLDQARTQDRLENLEEEKRRMTKQLGDNIKLTKYAISETARKIRDGYEMRKVKIQGDMFPDLHAEAMDRKRKREQEQKQ